MGWEYNSKANVASFVAGIVTSTAGNPATTNITIPASSSYYPKIAFIWAHWVKYWCWSIGIVIKPIECPFPNISAHIVNTKLVGFHLTNRIGFVAAVAGIPSHKIDIILTCITEPSTLLFFIEMYNVNQNLHLNHFK